MTQNTFDPLTPESFKRSFEGIWEEGGKPTTYVYMCQRCKRLHESTTPGACHAETGGSLARLLQRVRQKHEGELEEETY